MRVIIACAVLVLFGSLLAQSATATPVLYTYQGLPFMAAGGPLITTADFITAEALVDFNGAGAYSALEWSLSASLLTFSNDTPNLIGSQANFTLDDAGNVLTWTFYGYANVHGGEDSLPDEILSYSRGPNSGSVMDLAMSDNGNQYPCMSEALAPNCSLGRTYVGPGVWTATPVNIPEPMSLLLLSIGVVTVGMAKRRRP